MNRTSRSPRPRITRTFSRTDSTLRCRNRAENMNGVWQNRQA